MLRDAPAPPKFLDRLREIARVRHLSHPTEEACHDWAKRNILFLNKRHPNEMGEDHVARFLTHLAVERNVAASTQN